MSSETNISSLVALSPVDGRYASKTNSLSPYFSEFGLIKYRVIIEIKYLIALSENNDVPLSMDASARKKALDIIADFNEGHAARIKDIEKVTNHDVKAVEYFLKEELKGVLSDDEIEFIHFGLTSQDINNSAVPLSIQEALSNVVIPSLKEVIGSIESLAREWKGIPMLARTHGQPASPTTLGKEFMVFVERLKRQLTHLENHSIQAKFGGATGNFNAHQVAYPNTNWTDFANRFISSLGLERQQITTQIEHYDELANLLDCFARINTILTDYCRDVWTYISMEYFKQKLKEGEIGSSAMPHKVNPIDFENAEGNLGIASAVLKHLSGKLPISRLQRDLTDSTVLRNIGVPFGHILIAFSSILKGNGKLLLNESAIARELENNWMVVAEAIQTILRSTGFEKPYEALKALTRTNTQVGQAEIHDFIENLEVETSIKQRLLQITPQNYIGNAHDLFQ